MKIFGAEATRSHAMLIIIIGGIISGVLSAINHPLIYHDAAVGLFGFFTGTFVPVVVEWLRETPTSFI